MAERAVSPDQREQRMQAVAKLKRAASLPRMKDGRRPPMHVDGVSEGERGNSDEENKPDSDTPPPETKVEPETEDTASTPTATRTKRRSRSRSRSRGSRDFKTKNRNAQSPTPFLGDSSQDEALAPLTLMQPSPISDSRFLRSPTPTAPDFSMLPYPVSPPTPLPSLETLSKNLNLFRSNSAGRMMAMHKLTGGTETYEPSLSPSPTPPLPLRRTNTVAGGERNAARAKMFNALAGRSNKDTDGSGGEELIAPSPSPTPKRRRRRSRRTSSTPNAAAGLSDSDFVSTSQNTPLVPTTPLPSMEPFADLPTNRDRSGTPNRLPNSRSHTPEYKSASPVPPPPKTSTPPAEVERTDPPRRRSVLVEEEDEERQEPAYFPNSSTPPHRPPGLPSPRPGPSHVSTDSEDTSAIGVPVFLSSRTPSRQDAFPTSPFTTPLKEKPELVTEEEEEVIYRADSFASNYDREISWVASPVGDREISWVASPVPEIRMPVDDDEDDDDEEDYEDERPLSPRSSAGFSPPEGIDGSSHRDSSDSQILLVESETSPDIAPSHVPPSPSSVAALSQNASVTSGYESTSQIYPTRLSVAASPLNAEFTDVEDRSLEKRNGDSASTSTWEKVKSTFTRSNSASGRRSRSNSIVTRERRDHTDSSISRESGASLTGSRTDKGETSSVSTVPPPLMLSQSASASYVSLATTPGSRGGVSPVPPPSSADLAKYQNSKLFPFPGIKKLEEQRNRAKGLLPISSSTPDVTAFANGQDEEQTPASYNGMQSPTYRTIPHQASDTGLMSKYNTSPFPPPLSTSPSTSSHPDYIDIVPSHTPPNSGSSNKLPMTLPGVKQWMKLFSGQVTSPVSPPLSPPADTRNGTSPFKKPSLSDLLRRKESDLEWDEYGSTPTSASGSTMVPKHNHPQDASKRSPVEVHVTSARAEYFDLDRTPKKRSLVPGIDSDISPSQVSPNVPSPPDLLSSTTPDPSSSLSDYPAHTTSESSSTTSSHYSLRADNHGSLVLERLDESLARGSRSPMWLAAIENTPRKFVMCVSTLQVVNPNTVKDRFLFLFSDILVIAKPLMQQDDNKLTAMERKFIVKSVVQLRHLKFSGSRSERQPTTPGSPRSPMIRSFTQQFAKNPDQAISVLWNKANAPEDPVLLGQVLFKTTELDRVQLGEYLSRRSSKSVLKSYVDCFGFVGLRLDIALRVFLLSIHIPSKNAPPNVLEYLLDSFASRWYDANAGIVAYDKDLAVRLVRAMVQLNELLHAGIAQEPGFTTYPRREVSCRDFVSAFRRYDVRNLVFDELLEDIYDAIRQERLSQARPSAVTSDIAITVKRPLPSRLTYKVQSEPIIVRISQSDPHFSIHLFGQDLVFDPPVLTFHKSSEASFRVMGTSLGTKRMIFRRSGPNALKYSGLPLSSSLTIERAFMRNTFQVAFTNHQGTKRRYMFSVDDSVLCHTWLSALKRNIDICLSNNTSSVSSNSPGLSKFHRAAEAMAFRALQETLIGTDASESTLQKALRRLSNSQRNSKPGNGNAATNGTKFSASYHARSKSRSQVYHRHGAGQNELELGGKDDLGDNDESPRPDAPVWTGRDLELQCLQNSSIGLVLSYLQVGSPDQGQQFSGS